MTTVRVPSFAANNWKIADEVGRNARLVPVSLSYHQKKIAQIATRQQRDLPTSLSRSVAPY